MDNLKAEQLIKEYLPIVKGIATKMGCRYSNIQYDDVIQAGRLAILDACKKYQKNKGMKLSCYIYLVCRSAMFDSLYGNGKHNILYGNLQTRYQKVYNIEYISYDVYRDNLEYILQYDPSYDNTIKIDRQELITSLRNYLVLNYGTIAAECMIRAFAGKNSKYGVSIDYEFISKHYPMLSKHYFQNRGRKTQMDIKRLDNIRKNILRILWHKFTTDSIGVQRLIPCPK